MLARLGVGGVTLLGVLACSSGEVEDPGGDDVRPPAAAPDAPETAPGKGRKRGKGGKARTPARCDVKLALTPSREVTVHDGPRGAVRATVPGYFYVSAHAMDATDGWFKIDALAIEISNDAGDPAELPTGGSRGWIAASDLYAVVAPTGTRDGGGVSARLFAEPDLDAEVLQVFPDVDGQSLQIRGCDGPWLQGTAAGVTGWVHPAQICSHTQTTCNGYDEELDRRFDD